ncbi:metal ABC transporter permease [Bacillota bacterium LX-D]|nr:metal ABC transporter permease [Bacillota bacterium LX-D]
MLETYYLLMEKVLPFAWVQHLFMKNAFLAVLLITPVFGILGTMIVNNRMAFFADALGHSALTGIALGVILGLVNPLWAMLLFSIFLAAAIIYVKNFVTTSTDTIIGVFSTTAVALGIVILSQGGGFNKYSQYLIGDLLSISPEEIKILFYVFLGVLLFWGVLFNKLLIVSLNPTLARSRGIKVQFLEIFFGILTAIVVTAAIKWVGLLIISSLLILPATTARNLAGNVRQYHFLSIAFALASGIIGLIFSYYWGTATGATIVLCAALFCIITFGIKLLHP